MSTSASPHTPRPPPPPLPGSPFRMPKASSSSAAAATLADGGAALLSQLNLETYQSVKLSLLIDESYQSSLEKRACGAEPSRAAAANATTKSHNNNNNDNSNKKTATYQKISAEVRSLRWEQNETLARREQLAEWIRWLHVALQTFASPAAAVEVFVMRTHELCAAGIDRSRVPSDVAEALLDKHKNATAEERRGSPRSVSRTQLRQQHRLLRRLSVTSHVSNDDDDDVQEDEQMLDDLDAQNTTQHCQVLATLASLAALLALGEAWGHEYNSSSGSGSSAAASSSSSPPTSSSPPSLLPPIRTQQQQQQQQQRVAQQQQQQQQVEQARNIRGLIRSVVDDLSSGVFFTPPSLGCSTPDDVLRKLGGCRAFSDVFNDMLSVAVFHRDRAETCRYLERRRETVLNRCIDNFRRDHARAALRAWRYYTMQQLRKRKRIWNKLVRSRELMVMKQHIESWRKFATHVHLASIMSANQRNEQILAQMRNKNKQLADKVWGLERDHERRAADMAQAQEKFDVVEVRDTASRERLAAATAKYHRVRRRWADVVRVIFNDDHRVPYHVSSAAEKDVVASRGTNRNSNSSRSKNNEKASSSSGADESSLATMLERARQDAERSWEAGSKAVRWAKWLLGVYAPTALQEWERAIASRLQLQRAGRLADTMCADLDDRFGDIPFISMPAVKELLHVLVSLHEHGAINFSEMHGNTAGDNINNNNNNNNNPLLGIAGTQQQQQQQQQEQPHHDEQQQLYQRGRRATAVAFAEEDGLEGSGALGASGGALRRSSVVPRVLGAAASTTLARNTLATEVWELYAFLCDNGALLMKQRWTENSSSSNNHNNGEPAEEAASPATPPPPTARMELQFFNPPIVSDFERKDRNKSIANSSSSNNNNRSSLPALSPQGSGGSFRGASLTQLQNTAARQRAAATTTTKSSSEPRGEFSDDSSDDEQEQERMRKLKEQQQQHKLISMTLSPPISLVDLIRQDQLRLLLLLVHLAQIWCGGYCGTFFCKSKDEEHDRRPALVVSRLAEQPRQGKLATVEEAEDMMTDWSQGVQALSSAEAGGGGSGDSALFQVGLDEGIRDSIEHGEASMFRQTLQGLFDLLTLGDVIEKQRMEQLLQCVVSDERRKEHELAMESVRQKQQAQEHEQKKKQQPHQQHKKPGGGRSQLTSFFKEQQRNDNTTTFALDGDDAVAPRLLFPPWPDEGITNISELGLYISDAAHHLGFPHRRTLAEHLTETLLMSSQVAFAHSVFVPSDALRSVISHRQPLIRAIFNDFSVVSRTAPKTSSSSSSSKARSVSPASRQQQQQQEAPTASLVFSKKSFVKWLDQVVVRHFGKDATPAGAEAESMYQSAVGFAPERDSQLVELLVCATASFVFPSPFSSTEEKVEMFFEGLR